LKHPKSIYIQKSAIKRNRIKITNLCFHLFFIKKSYKGIYEQSNLYQANILNFENVLSQCKIVKISIPHGNLVVYILIEIVTDKD